MAEIIFCFIIFIPLYGVLIWSYYCPEESLMFGKRWMYKEDPEISEGAIRYIKVTSLIAVIAITLVFITLIIFQLF